MPSRPPKGVMNINYSKERKSKKHLIFRYKSRAFETYSAFQKFLPEISFPKILDFGSADGVTLLETHRLLNAKSSLGIEYSKELIDSAPNFPENCSLIQGDVTENINEIKINYYDLVTSLAILEHLENPIQLFEKAHDALKIGGIIIASCPAPIWDKISGKAKLHHDEFHAHDFEQSVFDELSQKAGFQKLQYRRFMSAPIGFLPYLNLNVSPRFSHYVDKWLHIAKIFNWTFVNQLYVAQKIA